MALVPIVQEAATGPHLASDCLYALVGSGWYLIITKTSLSFDFKRKLKLDLVNLPYKSERTPSHSCRIFASVSAARVEAVTVSGCPVE